MSANRLTSPGEGGGPERVSDGRRGRVAAPADKGWVARWGTVGLLAHAVRQAVGARYEVFDGAVGAARE